MLNRVILIGRLVRDPELRYTDNGKAFGTFTLAIDREYVNNEGETDTDFIDVITWERLAENCTQFLEKGRMTAVEGRLQIRKNKKEEKTYINPEVVARNVRFIDWPEKAETVSKNEE